MRISELSRVSGVPVATIKFYLREGLLAEGVRTSPNQAHYDDTHLQRLRLIRALVGVGGLSLAATRSVLQQIDHPAELTLDLLGAAHQTVATALPDEIDLHPAVSLLRRWGWDSCVAAAGLGDGDPGAEDPGDGDPGDENRIDDAVAALAVSLKALADAGFEVDPSRLDVYAEAMMRVARAEIDDIPLESAAAVRYVVLGTVLVEPVLLALRRLAQREASAARFPPSS